MNATDIHQTLSSFLGTFLALMFMEALVKPIATKTGKWLLHKLDHRVGWVPDWLSEHDPSENG